MKRWVGAALLALLIALCVLLLFRRPDPPPTSPPAAFGDEVRPVSRAPRVWKAPVEPVESEQEDPTTTRAVQRSFAEGAGLLAIRCFVGTQYDDLPLVGRFSPRVQDGWFSAVVREWSGTKVAEARYDTGEGLLDFDLENPFYVTWDAPKTVNSARCRVHSVRYAELRVLVLDSEGEPVPGARVHGCGGRSKSDDAGVAVLEVRVPDDDGGCTVSSTHYDRQRRRLLVGEANAPALVEHQTASMTLGLVRKEGLPTGEEIVDAREARIEKMNHDLVGLRKRLLVLEGLENGVPPGPGAAWLSREVGRHRDQVESGEELLESWEMPLEPPQTMEEVRERIQKMRDKLGEELLPPDLLPEPEEE